LNLIFLTLNGIDINTAMPGSPNLIAHDRTIVRRDSAECR